MLSKADKKRQAGWLIVCLFAPFYIMAMSEHKFESKPPEDFVRLVDERYRGNTWSMESKVILIDKSGKKNIRVLSMFGKMEGEDEKTIVYINEPKRLKGTGVLSFDWKDPAVENESWLYLPEIGSTTRLTTSNRSDYFLGTDFTYGDIEGLEVEDFNYELLKLSPLEKEAHVRALPKNNDVVEKYGYNNIEYWVDLERHVFSRAKYELKSNGWVKYFSQFELVKKDEVWVSNREQMILTKNGKKIHTTIIERVSVSINPELSEGLFTKSGLERLSQ